MNDRDREAATNGGEENPDRFRPQDERMRNEVDALRERLEGNRMPPRTSSPNKSHPEQQGERTKNRTDRDASNKDKRQSGRRHSSVDTEEKGYRDQRRERERHDRRSRASSHSPERRNVVNNAQAATMSPYSALGKTGRPAGYSRDQINAMGVAPALQVKGWQREEDRHREAVIAKPGKNNTNTPC